MPMLCGRLEGFDMLSVTLPALARIVDLLNFSFDFSAESWYVAFGAAETAVAATPPRPTASTAAPAASLLLLMLPSTRVPDAEVYAGPAPQVQGTHRGRFVGP